MSSTLFWANAVKPLVISAGMYLICKPARKAVRLYWPEGKIKNILLTDLAARRREKEAKAKTEREDRTKVVHSKWVARGAKFKAWIQKPS